MGGKSTFLVERLAPTQLAYLTVEEQLGEHSVVVSAEKCSKHARLGRLEVLFDKTRCVKLFF